MTNQYTGESIMIDIYDINGCTNDGREPYWYTLDVFPTSYSKRSKQVQMYSKKNVNTGLRRFTLKEIADLRNRSCRRFVSMEAFGLDDYAMNRYHHLFIDIDDIKDSAELRLLTNARTLVTYEDMVKLVADFRSPLYPEVYVRESSSTHEKNWKFHIYVKTQEPYRFLHPKRLGTPDKKSDCLTAREMTFQFLDDFKAAFPDYFESHAFAQVDQALFNIHQSLHSASDDKIRVRQRIILPDTKLAHIPTLNKHSYDPYRNVPDKYKDVLSYPCNADMRYKAWGVTYLPRSFDVRLPSQSFSDKKVGDGHRHGFARLLARNIWVAVKFNLRYYAEFAEPYDDDRLYRMVMREFYLGADLYDVNIPSIEKSVKFKIEQMDADTRSIDDIIQDLYGNSVKYDDDGRVVADPYKIKMFDRTSHQHSDKVIDELVADGVIVGRVFAIEGANLHKVLAAKHITLQTLRNHKICFRKRRNARSDKGKTRRPRSVWADYMGLCRRDVDGRVIVPVDVGKLARFRKFCSAHKVRYVSSPLPSDDPLCIGRVVDMPKELPWIDPWPPEDVA